MVGTLGVGLDPARSGPLLWLDAAAGSKKRKPSHEACLGLAPPAQARKRTECLSCDCLGSRSFDKQKHAGVGKESFDSHMVALIVWTLSASSMQHQRVSRMQASLFGCWRRSEPGIDRWKWQLGEFREKLWIVNCGRDRVRICR